MHSEHITRVRSAVKGVYGLRNLADWIEKKTFLDGNLFSFENHEFQKYILEDDASTSIIVKCAQIGLSELAYRYAIASVCNIEDFTVIYTFPASGDAERNCKTRIDPIITGSPEVKRLVNGELNNSEVKQFGRNSFIFFKGTFSSTQALSTPANAVIHDEWDKSDTTQGSVYVSRLQHKPHKIRKIFSTPTIEKFGVSKEAITSRRMRMFAKCGHCNHWFMPDYFQNVVIPGYDGDKESITKKNVHTLQWQGSYLACPRCGERHDTHHSKMEFICENPEDNYVARSWFITPFCVPESIISVPYLVHNSTEYEKFSEFKNQALGLTGEDKNDAILESDIEEATVRLDLKSSELHMMGSDMGLTCHVVIGRLGQDGKYMVVHRESIHYTEFEKRTQQLISKFRVILHVMDSMPYTDLVTRICNARSNHWGAIFSSSKAPMAYNLQEQNPEPEEGKMDLRLVKVNRHVALDEVLGLVKNKQIVIQSSDQDDEFKAQMTSCKRLPEANLDGDLVYKWKKTGKEEDHYHFAFLYFYLAVQMRHTAGMPGPLAARVPLVRSFKAPRYGVTGT